MPRGTLEGGHEPWTDADWGIAAASARRLFNPTSPIDEDRLFSGRLRQVNDLLGVVYERGAHAVLFGERGVGKSSLANVVRARVPAAVTNIRFLKTNCRPEDTFFTLWANMLWEFKHEGVAISEFLRDEDRHFIITKILETALPRDTQHVLVFDEFDRIKSAEAKNAMADTIKHLSDYPQNVTIIVVGVGFSIEELFGAHPSISRCCQQVVMPRMSRDELVEIILDRYQPIGLNVVDATLSQLVDLAQGLPGYAHLVGREAALSGIDRRSRKIEAGDYEAAIVESLRRAQESVVNAYNKAVYSPKENIYKQVLLACALAKQDERGKFSASDIRDQLEKILKRRVEISGFTRHLAAFCDEERGQVIRKTGKPKRFQYQFVDAPLQPYIVMAGKRDNLV